jgi:hypothetical protein
MSGIPNEILLIAERLRTQDNRITSHPIFMVQERPDSQSNWTNLQPCFTNAAAEAFIERQSHNYRHLRVYVASGYDNPEWRIVRDWLMSLEFDALGGAQ